MLWIRVDGSGQNLIKCPLKNRREQTAVANTVGSKELFSMRFPSMANKKELLSAYGQIVLGCVIGAAAYPAFLVPNRIAPGGLTGMAIILNHQ